MDDTSEYLEAARKMLQIYGREAQARALTRAEQLHAEGNDRLYSLWMGVHRAIEHLRYHGRPTGAI